MTSNSLIIQTSNLQQAFEMSIYTWSVALILGVVIWLLARYLFQNKLHRYRFFAICAIVVGAYTAVTSMIWLYYFNLVLAVPAYFLLHFICYSLHVLHRGGLGLRLAIGCSIATMFFSLFGAWFFGMFSF